MYYIVYISIYVYVHSLYACIWLRPGEGAFRPLNPIFGGLPTPEAKYVSADEAHAEDDEKTNYGHEILE